ncbi:MAG: LLM class flavin-dependent oxidoreductase [Betaproteobacteria bacterium]|nr:LLM class flavin-dependent oxidoreductase [Betaproteobacteria bacterium]
MDGIMKLGVSFDGFAPYGEALGFAKEAAAAGAGSLWMADHLGYREPIVSCLGFASAIADVRVVPTAVSPYLRHPMPTAMQMATLAEAAPGRVALALGTGNPLFLGESGESIDKPIAVAREFVTALRALWSGRPVEQEAMRFRLRGARMMFTPPAPIPIYLAPMKPQMLALSGKIADGVVLSAGLSPGFVRESLKHAAAGAKEARRDYGALHVAGYISFAASPDGRRAVEEVRKKLAFLLRNRYIDDNIAHSGIPIDQAAIIEAMGRRDYAAAAKLVPDAAVEAFAVAGTVQQCCDQLTKYKNAGLGELVLLLAGNVEDQRFGLSVIRELSA